MSGNSKKIEPRRLKGFRDYMPDLMELRSGMQAVIRSKAKLAGFREIGTPVLEYAETLLGQGSDETDKQVYRFEDHGDRKVAMRFDLPVPFARFVAEHQGDLIFPFKRLQIGDVWRGENTQKGRYREFCQCDLDIIGADSATADIEILSCFYRILCGFDLGGFTMRLGNRVLLSALIQRALPEVGPEGEKEALIALDKLDKIGAPAVTGLLGKIAGATESGGARLLEVLLSKDSDGGSDRQVIRAFLTGNDSALAEMSRMELILSAVAELAKSESGGKCRLDLSIARGLGYYTGVVFETTLDQIPGFGSISSGGRYNNLAERFTNRSLPGVGGSIGLDRLLAGLEEMGKLTKQVSCPVFIAIATDDAIVAATMLAGKIRDHGIACDLGLTTGKLGNQFKHADRLGCKYVITLGTTEVASRSANLKEMSSGHEWKAVPVTELMTILDQKLNSQ
jgi:histidyl-tRNA synthetase